MNINKDDLDRLSYAIYEVSLYAGNETSWTRIRREIMNSIPTHIRKCFSPRDPKTGKYKLTELEKDIVELYLKESGVKLIID